ncbi:MAG: hypothetical protein K2X41_07505 [Hyphomicrobium sp.]|nr:hypothetical protein [Hyphomicrobium sp.]
MVTAVIAAMALTVGAPLVVRDAASEVRADAPTWDRAANIKDAAERLAKLHQRQGSQGVLKFLDACYRTHLLSSTFNQGVEACLAQDYIHAQTLATIYARLPAQARQQRGIPSPELISQGMQQRLITTFRQYKITPDEAVVFQKLVEKHGLSLFLQAVFPNADAKSFKPGEK